MFSRVPAQKLLGGVAITPLAFSGSDHSKLKNLSRNERLGGNKAVFGVHSSCVICYRKGQSTVPLTVLMPAPRRTGGVKATETVQKTAFRAPG